MTYLIGFIIVWPLCSVVLGKLIWGDKYRNYVVCIMLFLGYIFGLYLEFNFNVLSAELGFIYYKDINDQIEHYELESILLFVFLGIVSCGAVVSGIVAHHRGKSFFFWFFFGLFANFSTLFLLLKSNNKINKGETVQKGAVIFK